MYEQRLAQTPHSLTVLFSVLPQLCDEFIHTYKYYYYYIMKTLHFCYFFVFSTISVISLLATAHSPTYQWKTKTFAYIKNKLFKKSIFLKKKQQIEKKNAFSPHIWLLFYVVVDLTQRKGDENMAFYLFNSHRQIEIFVRLFIASCVLLCVLNLVVKMNAKFVAF